MYVKKLPGHLTPSRGSRKWPLIKGEIPLIKGEMRLHSLPFFSRTALPHRHSSWGKEKEVRAEDHSQASVSAVTHLCA